MPPKKRKEAEAMGITTAMVREMNITGNLNRSNTWASAIAEYKRLNPTVDAPTTSTEIALAPASSVVPATPQGTIVPHTQDMSAKQINQASKNVTNLLERYIVRTLSPEEGINLYQDAKDKLQANPKVLEAFRSQNRNHQLLKVALARYNKEAQLYEQLHDQYTATAPSSLSSMASSISGGMGAAVGATSSAVNTTAGVVSSMLSLAGSATSMGADAVNAGVNTMSWLTATTQPSQHPVLTLPSTAEPSSEYDSDDTSSQTSYTSAPDTSMLGGPMSTLSLGGDTYTLSTPASEPESFAGPYLLPPTGLEAYAPAPSAFQTMLIPATAPAAETSLSLEAPAPTPAPVPVDPTPAPDASAPAPVPAAGVDPTAPISGPATAPVSGAPISAPATAPVSGTPISAPATAPAIISEAQVKAMTDNAKAIIDATNALTAATRKAKSLSPDQLAVLSDQLEANPAVQNLVSSGLLKWDDLLRKNEDGKSVIDFTKIQKVSSAMRERSQSVSANTKQTYQRFAEERVRPGYKSNTKLKGLLSFTGPRFMPAPPFKK